MEVHDCRVDIKTFQIIDPSLSDDFTSQVVSELYKIEICLPNGTNYIHARDFQGDSGLDEARNLVEKIIEKGAVNMDFWREGDPVYGSE